MNYNETNILNNVNLKIQTGDIYGIVGKSGAGKSTLLRCVNGLEKFESGKISVDDVLVNSLNPKDLRIFQKNIGMIFQNFALLGQKTVYENIALPMICWNYNKKQIDERINYLLKIVGISEKRNVYPSSLSGGQKQRVAIARALSLEPKILLCDEATSALDPNTTSSIIELLKNINKELNITILVVTHEMNVIKSLCNKMAIVSSGEVKDTGLVENVFMNNSDALKNLLGTETIDLPKDYVAFKLICFSETKNNNILSTLSTDLNITYNIISASVDVFNGKSIGYIYISILEKDVLLLTNYLAGKKIAFEKLRKEVI